MSFQTDFFIIYTFISFSLSFSQVICDQMQRVPGENRPHRVRDAGARVRVPPSTASVAVYVTDSWGKGMSLYWRTDSCCARTTMRRRKTSSALSAPMTPIQVWIQANLYTTDHDASVFMNIFLGEFQKTFFVLYNTEEGLLKNASTVFCSYDECQNIDFYCMDRKH